METVTIPKDEYHALKEKAKINESLIVKLIKGLEDIREGKVKPWKRTTKH
ncbi:hypothetical protein J4216_05980 [Candidatus Woesearchaeota archaeon]|nr:hypothetical protein [Candidatus Woesearchaeota archaeon]